MPQAAIAAISLIGTAISAYAQYSQQNAGAEAARITAEQQAQAEESNARIAAMNETIAMNNAKEQQAQAAVEAQKARGRQRATLAQNGLLSSNTGLLLQEELDSNAKQQQSDIARQGMSNALNYTISGANSTGSAAIYRSNKANAQGGSKLGLIGGLLTGGASAYQIYKG